MAAVKTLKTLLQEDLDELKRLRDEVRLNLHLGGMEAKVAFAELEQKLEPLEARLDHAPRASTVNAALRLGNDLRRRTPEGTYKIIHKKLCRMIIEAL